MHTWDGSLSFILLKYSLASANPGALLRVRKTGYAGVFGFTDPHRCDWYHAGVRSAVRAHICAVAVPQRLRTHSDMCQRIWKVRVCLWFAFALRVQTPYKIHWCLTVLCISFAGQASRKDYTFVRLSSATCRSHTPCLCARWSTTLFGCSTSCWPFSTTW